VVILQKTKKNKTKQNKTKQNKQNKTKKTNKQTNKQTNTQISLSTKITKKCFFDVQNGQIGTGFEGYGLKKSQGQKPCLKIRFIEQHLFSQRQCVLPYILVIMDLHTQCYTDLS